MTNFSGVSIVDSDQVNASCIPLGLFFNLLKRMEIVSGVATNSGLVGSGDDKGGGAGLNRDLFCIVSTKVV